MPDINCCALPQYKARKNRTHFIIIEKSSLLLNIDPEMRLSQNVCCVKSLIDVAERTNHETITRIVTVHSLETFWNLQALFVTVKCHS